MQGWHYGSTPPLFEGDKRDCIGSVSCHARCLAVLRSFLVLMGVKKNCWCFSCTQSPNSAVGRVACGEILCGSTVQPTIEPRPQPATLGMTECLGHVLSREAIEFSHHLGGYNCSIRQVWRSTCFYPSSRIHEPASGLKPGVSTSNQSTDSSWTGLELPICHGFCLSGGTGESEIFDASLFFFICVCCKVNI